MSVDPLTAATPAGTPFALLPPRPGPPGPALLLFAMAAADTLLAQPYGRVGRLLHARGWTVASLDLPCHGADRRPGEPAELAGWAACLAAGEDFVVPFRQRVDEVVAHLVASGLADPGRLAAAGTSRGGFLALHAAAGNPRIGAVAASAPVTDLLALTEFAGLEASLLARQRAVAHAVDALAGRAVWLTIGDGDQRVDTDRAVALARGLARAAAARGLPSRVSLHVLPVPGHTSRPEWHDQAAAWLQEAVTLPEVDP
ncbi:MAG: prolyl oligopeptidase family serine peptidase [Gemmatimonadota bacterium]